MSPVLAGPELRARFFGAWARSDRIFSFIKPSAWLTRPIPLRHVFLFYLGHLPAFTWIQISRGVLGRLPFDPELDRLFEQGIDPLNPMAATRATDVKWPELSQVLAYRDGIRDEILDALDEVSSLEAWGAEDPMIQKGRVLRLVLEHEWMHHETLLYMVQALDHAEKNVPIDFAPTGGDRGSAQRDVLVPAGRTTLGADFAKADYGWDNEFPVTPVEVPAFQMDALPVTNEEFAEFVSKGGYKKEELWSTEGWAWRKQSRLERPWTWTPSGRSFHVRTLFADVPFATLRHTPVQVSWAEADAYARWKGRRLPTEAEFHRAAYATPSGEERLMPWGDGLLTPERANANFVRWTPEPVGLHPQGASAWGIEELVGNGWEWTSTVFGPYAGFTPWARTYPGYSADFFDGHHRVILGASWVTESALIRRSYRNWFQPHYPYVFSKFRTVGAP